MTDPTRWPILVAALLFCLAAAGCVQPSFEPGGLNVWAVSGSHTVAMNGTVRRETNCYSHQDKRISLRAARNETVACQLVVSAQERPLARVTLTIGQLSDKTTTLPSETVRAYRPHYVRTTREPSWQMIRQNIVPSTEPHADILVPLNAPKGGQPFDVAANSCLPVWIDVAIDASVAPGVYTSKIEIASDGTIVDQLQLQVQVLPLTLPNEMVCPIHLGVDLPKLLAHHLEREGRPYAPAGLVDGDPMAEQVRGVLDGTLRMVHAHGCSPFLTGIAPAISLEASGQLRLAWETYDRTVSSYLDGSAYPDGRGGSAWPMPVTASFPLPASYGGANSPAYGVAFQECLKQCLEHFRQKGWLDRHFVWTAPPVRAEPEPANTVLSFGTAVRQASPSLRLLTTSIPQSMKPFGWLSHEFDPALSNVVSIWAPPAQFYDEPTMKKCQAMGKSAWMLVEHPPFSPSFDIGTPEVDPRALAWQAYRYKIQGILVPTINDWPETPVSTVVAGGGSWLVYPGKPFGILGAVPSVRLKQLRRGLQDVAYLSLLKGIDKGRTADTIAKALFRYGGTAAYGDHYADGVQWPWASDPDLWDLARRLTADRILRIQGGAPGDKDAEFVQTVEWRRFIDGACKVRIYCEGVRVRSLDPSSSGGEAEVVLHLVVRNDKPEPITGRLRFGKLPVGWRAVANDLPVEALPSLARAKVSLVARASAIGTNELGIAYIPVVFDGGRQGQVEIRARLTQVTARGLERPVVVDGDLSDWPPGIRNVAGDFIVIAGQDPLLAGREPTGRATQQTVVFTGFDSQHLYLAFNCREDKPDSLPATSSNFVRYEGLLPMDGDLLEVLIDPTNAGTGQPIDVYHLVIRPTGAAFAERGVSTDTWGTSRHWPAEVRVAAARQERGWTAELSIPLSAFGREARSIKRWAINFGRYQPRLGQYSSWSGARRYLYNTRSFGNLRWP
ncbi:MAG: DUF4091 domain-containing protein [Phycisphaerae bacterium]|nr:DUF4091 domain-containing protein [Phycisphaerae bacterium]